MPAVPVLGNHDTNYRNNFSDHFNTAALPPGLKIAKPGTVYSFEYGDALFMVLNTETYSNAGELDAMANWMRTTANGSDKKWRIVTFHRAVYSGGAHQEDADIKTLRRKFAPLFDELRIALVIQGHDHTYSVIGPVKNGRLAEEGVSGVAEGRATDRNGNGKKGGVFNAADGTMYFVNGAAGMKLYAPKSKRQMKDGEAVTGVKNYYGLFSGKFDSAHTSTFSRITVSDEDIRIDTYMIDPASGGVGKGAPWDSLRIVKANDAWVSASPAVMRTEESANAFSSPEASPYVTQPSGSPVLVFRNWLAEILRNLINAIRTLLRG